MLISPFGSHAVFMAQQNQFHRNQEHGYFLQQVVCYSFNEHRDKEQYKGQADHQP